MILFVHQLAGQVRHQLLRAESFTVLPGLHIRALEALNDSTVWFGASRGVWGYTRDGGKHWHIDSLRMDSISPQFRSIAVLNDSTALLLGIASPAHLLKTTDRGRTWRQVYRNTHKDIFFDSMVFRDQKNGLAIGDPIEGCFQLLQTRDGGETWRQLSCAGFPTASEGEACFATSNTNIDMAGKYTWFVTGGKRSRIFRSADGGRTFKAFDVPLPQGETMTGIFSFDFYDTKLGVISGGHYEKTDSSLVSLATTADGGQTWNPLRFSRPFFGSCVRFRNPQEAIVTGHDGTFRVALKSGQAEEIRDLSAASLKYFTLRLSPSGNTLWLAGSGGRLARVRIADLR